MHSKAVSEPQNLSERTKNYFFRSKNTQNSTKKTRFETSAHEDNNISGYISGKKYVSTVLDNLYELRELLQEIITDNYHVYWQDKLFKE